MGRGAVAACAAAALALGAASEAVGAGALAAPGDASSRTAGSTRSGATVHGDGARSHPHAGRGALVRIAPLGRFSPAEVRDFLTGVEVDDSTVRLGVRLYRLTYRTVDAGGEPTTATGLFALPSGGPRKVALVSDTHGTMVHRDYAPSMEADSPSRSGAFLHASAGRAVAAPDYLGLGEGPGTHPYMDTRSTVTASVDMLRAARSAAGRLGGQLTSDVYATGFSQGGQAAMALGRELSDGRSYGFRLRGLAPVAGPYDIEGEELPALFDGRVNDTSGLLYASYFLVAQNRLRPLYADPSEAFRAPYAHEVEGLFDSEHTEEDVIGTLPANATELLTPEYRALMEKPRGPLLDAVRANDGSCDWRPEVPVGLYASGADTDVPIGNAESCAEDLAAHGVRAPVLDQGPVDHFGSFRAAAPKIVRWFDRLQHQE
ncbi:Secretory lipase [Streptomyces sp. YIM 130001]|nr:Secretory lipase [Streptomyces sp. YIM 130001]